MDAKWYEFLINIIPWIPTILFVLILLGHMIGGLRRGLSKSIKLFITFILAIVVAIIFYFVFRNNFDTLAVSIGEPISKKFFNKSFADLFQLSDSGVDNTKLSDYIKAYVAHNANFQTYVEQAGLSVDEAAKLIYSVSMLAVQIALFIVCVVVFYLAKIIFYIFYLIFAREGRRKKKIDAAYSNQERDTPYKKKKAWGMLVGAIRGLIVALVVMVPFGIVSMITTNYKTVDSGMDLATNQTDSTIIDVTEAISKFSTTGITKVLTDVKNPEGVPIYLLVADKLLTSEYTSEDGQTMTISLSSDIAPLSSSVCLVAYEFLVYGYDTSKQYSEDELKAFITQDTEIDGKTLEESISEILDNLSVDEKSVLGAVVNAFAVGYTMKYVGIDDTNKNEDEATLLTDKTLPQKLLYHVFVGDNALKATTIVNGNAGEVCSLLVDVIKEEDKVKALSGALSGTSSETLALGVNKTADSSAAKTTGTEFTTNLYSHLSKLTFYNDSLNSLLSDCIEDVISYALPDFDLTTTNGDSYTNIKWTETISTLFDTVGSLIDTIQNNDLKDKDSLVEYYINELSNKDSAVYTRINNIVDTSAISILLNTKGFNDLISDTLNNSLSSTLSDNVTLVDTNWGTYTDSEGVVHTGELKKLLNCAGPTIAQAYNILKDVNGTLNKDQMKNLIDIFTNDDSTIYDLIDPSEDNHSNFIHSLLSDVLLKVNIKISDESSFNLYVSSDDLETLTISSSETKSVISYSSLSSVLKFLDKISDDAYDLVNGSLDVIDFVKNQATNLKTSTFILENAAKIIYELGGDYLTIPTGYELDSDNIDANISKWVSGENSEMNKVIDIISSFTDIVETIQDGGDTNQIIAEVVRDGGTTIKQLVNSMVINATVTKILIDSTAESSFKIYIPDYAYIDSYKETIKVDEFVAVAKYIKHAFKVDSTTTSVDLNNIVYNNLLSDEAISLLCDSSIMNTTIAYFFKDNISTMEAVKDYLVIPNSLLQELTSESILTNYTESSWKDEIQVVLSSMKLIGVEFDSSNNVSMNLKKVFYLADIIEGKDTTNVDTVYESQILKSSITKVLTDNDTIKVPNYALSDGIISKNEVSATLKTLKILLNDYLEDSTKEFNIDEIGDNLSLDKLTDDSTISSIKDSSILITTIAYYFNDNISTNEAVKDYISIPSTLSDELTNNTIITDYVSSQWKDEIPALLSAVEAIGVSFSGTNVSMSIKEVFNLADTNADGSTNADKVYESIILSNSITKVLTDNSMVKIPIYALDSGVIKISELKSTIKTLKTLLGTYLESDTFSMDEIGDNITLSKLTDTSTISLISSSSIMVSTIAYYFNDTISKNASVSDYLVIPSTLSDELTNNTIISNYESSSWKDEVPALLSSIELLGVEFNSDNSISMNIKKVFYLADTNETDTSKTNAAVLYESSILKSSVSSVLVKNDTIFVPNSSLDSDNTITLSEFEATMSSFKTLLGTHLSDSDFSMDNVQSYIDLSSYSSDIDTLINIVKPNIVNATIANLITSQDDTSEIIVPSVLSFTKDDQTNLATWLYTSAENGETIKMLKAVNDLGLLDQVSKDSLSIDSNVLKSLTDDNVDEICNSVIINATLINFLGTNKSESLYLPLAYTTTKATIISSYDSLAYVTNSETNNFLKGLVRLGATLNNTSFDMTLIKGLSEADSVDSSKTKLDVILNSDILWYSLSHYILSVDSIKISSSVKSTDSNSETYLTKEEIAALINSINCLSITDFSDISADSLLSLSDDEITEFFKSVIISYTISDKLFDVSTITLTNNDVEISNGEFFVKNSELVAFVKGVKVLTSDSLDNINVDATTVVNNSDKLIASSIIRTLVTDEIIDNDNTIVMSRLNKTTYETETFANTYYKYSARSLTSENICQLTASELAKFITAIKTYYGSSSVSFDIDYDSINLQTIDSSILDSTIILAGLQNAITTSIAAYNSYAPIGGYSEFSAEDNYIYYIYDTTAKASKVMAGFISDEDAKSFVALEQ